MGLEPTISCLGSMGSMQGVDEYLYLLHGGGLTVLRVTGRQDGVNGLWVGKETDHSIE
jgi:hypothetical protein